MTKEDINTKGCVYWGVVCHIVSIHSTRGTKI